MLKCNLNSNGRDIPHEEDIKQFISFSPSQPQVKLGLELDYDGNVVGISRVIETLMADQKREYDSKKLAVVGACASSAE